MAGSRLGWRKPRYPWAKPILKPAKASVVLFPRPVLENGWPMTGLEPALQPFPSCKSVISYRRHFCWASADGWGMKQDEVCEACQIKQAEWLAESRRA